MYRELTTLSNIHDCTPDKAIEYLRTHNSKLLFYSGFKLKYSEPALCISSIVPRTFNPNKLVWRHVKRRKRSKNEDAFTGPHRVIKKEGDLTYLITSHKRANVARPSRVSLNDIKKFTVPDTSEWKLNTDFLEEAKQQLGCNEDLPITIDFLSMETFTLDSLSNNPGSKLVVIPDSSTA